MYIDEKKGFDKDKPKKQEVLFEIFRRLASTHFNYPTIKMCSDGDVIAFLKSLKT